MPNHPLLADDILWQMYLNGEIKVDLPKDLEEWDRAESFSSGDLLTEGEKVALRVGDNAEYETYDSPYDAGFALGEILAGTGKFKDIATLKQAIKIIESGIEIKNLFHGR